MKLHFIWDRTFQCHAEAFDLPRHVPYNMQNANIHLTPYSICQMEFTMFTTGHMISVGRNKEKSIIINALWVMSYIRPFWVTLHVHAHSHAHLAQQGLVIKLVDRPLANLVLWHHCSSFLSFSTWRNIDHKMLVFFDMMFAECSWLRNFILTWAKRSEIHLANVAKLWYRCTLRHRYES